MAGRASSNEQRAWEPNPNHGLTRLDMETKVALMAALIYDGGDVEMTVARAIEIERSAHEQVGNFFREKKRD